MATIDEPKLQKLPIVTGATGNPATAAEFGLAGLGETALI